MDVCVQIPGKGNQLLIFIFSLHLFEKQIIENLENLKKFLGTTLHLYSIL